MDFFTIILTVILGSVLLVVAVFWGWLGQRAKLALSYLIKTHLACPAEEQATPQRTMGQANRESGKGTTPEVGPDAPAVDVLPDKPLTPRGEDSDILSQQVSGLNNHLVLLRKYVSRQACGKGRALLEALGLTSAQIAKYYGMYPLNEEESVQDGLQVWIGGDINTTWRGLLEAMETAGIAIQQRDGLKKELYSRAGGEHVANDEEGARSTASATAGSDATVGHPSIIPDIKAEYVEVKGAFVNICTKQGTPTLDEVKEHCIDLIEGVFTDMPRIIRHEDDIKKAETFTELARVVCFHLSTWISFDFFKKVITHFQPALKSVEERLRHYEDQLTPLLQQKLECIAELQQREKVPGNMAELAVKYRLDEDGLLVKDLITKRDFLAQRLRLPKHLLQVLSWGKGSIVITYWIMQEVLPLAELALYREDARAELTQHGVENVHFASHPSEQPGLVDQPPQTVHLQRRAIVTVLDAHRQDLDTTSLTSGLKGMGILTEEQCQKLASLDDERRHEALLYALLAHDGPDTYDKLVECVELRDASIAADLQATFEDVKKLPGALSVISSSQVHAALRPMMGMDKPSAPVPAHGAAAVPEASMIPSSDIPQAVMHPPCLDWGTLGKCRKVIQHRPGGGVYYAVALSSEGLLAVTNNGNCCVHLVTKDGNLVRSIGKGVLGNALFGVAFDLRGNVWVTDSSNNRIVKLTKSGRFLQTIRNADGESDCFTHLYGVSVSPEGMIYICDSGNHRVTVCDDEGKLMFAFGSEGRGPRQFDQPRDIAFGSDGLVYVTDGVNERVCVWSKEGTFKRDFQTKYAPALIAATIDNHLLITTQSSNTVMVYTLEGEIVHEFGGHGSDLGQFNYTAGICIDDTGIVFVVDRFNRRIQVF